MTQCLLEAKGVTKNYDDGRIQALRGVDVQINAADTPSAVPAEAGNRRCCSCSGGLDLPSGGEIRFKGTSLANSFDLDYSARSGLVSSSRRFICGPRCGGGKRPNPHV